jgi:hypothetical protein
MRTTLLLVAALLSSGCISALAGDHPLPDPAASGAPAGPNAGSPATHGLPQRTETPVKVELGAGGYVASKDVTVRNDFGGAANAKLRLATQNGAIAAAAWSQGGYQLAAHLEGRGKTEQEARAALDTLAVDNQDTLAGGLLGFGLQVKFNEPPAPLPVTPPVGLPQVNTLQRSASIVASLPAAPAEDLGVDTTNGHIRVEGLHGPRLDADTTNGALDVAGAWDAAKLDTTNGGIHLAGLVNDLHADTTNGGIDGTLESQRTCTQSLETTNGAIDVRVKDDGHGYAIHGHTTNGRVTIDVAGAQASGKDSQHATTPGFDGEAVQVTLKASSTNGNVEVRSA